MEDYRLVADSDRFWTLELPQSDLGVLDDFGVRPLSEGWKPLRAAIDRHGKRGDFLSLDIMAPCLTEKARDHLGHFFEDGVELLDVEIDIGTVFALNVFGTVVCLDLERSEITRYSTGGLRSVETFVPKKVPIEHDVFLVPELPSDIVISGRFREDVEREGLEGLIFSELLWTG